MTAPGRLAALDGALALLACPVCLGPLDREGSTLRCQEGHAFDVARQGYAALATGATVPGDTAAMVRDRAAFLAAGHYAPITEAVVAAVQEDARRIADLASGPGTYLAAVLEHRHGARGVALDASAPAIRLAAAAHPRAAAATADLRTRIPLATGSIDAALVVFGPRHGGELDRVLAPDGVVVVVIPEAAHLTELRGPFGTLAVGADKGARLQQRMLPLRPVADDRITARRTLSPEDVARVVLMGPSGHHLDHDDVRRRAAEQGPVAVTVDVRVLRFAR
ncbi:putative RNA methyltransferase [Amnibacterium sp.]|uniref:putative RNA methyltransferase n=1 Tax=Amnibacterium sp. TaxID=1872496 RepID=UPI003F7B49AC